MSDRIEHVREYAQRMIAELRHRERPFAASVLELDLEHRERAQNWSGFRREVEMFDTLSRHPFPLPL